MNASQLELALQSFLVSYCQLSKRQLVLIIDNLDYLYHRHDRESFFDTSLSEHRETVLVITKLLSEFVSDSNPLGKLGANIFCALRDHSYEILRVSRELLPDLSLRFDHAVFEIQTPDWHTLIERRCDLLEKVVSQTDTAGKRRSFNVVVKPLVNSITEGKTLVQHFQAMHNHGLRDLMDYFAQYSWVETRASRLSTPDAGLRRFIDHHALGLITFMLNGHRRYSQWITTFPNIFLVNVQEVDKSIKFPIFHRHSYWLKWLLLQYVMHREDRHLAVAPSALIDIFSGGGAGVYEPDLVRACLGSMSEAGASNLLTITREVSREKAELMVSTLRVSARGRHCMNYMFHKFYYLQLVVEDYMLPVPKSIGAEVAYDITEIDYSYLIEPDDIYGQMARKCVSLKCLQVLLFLEVLDVALLCEQARYETVFRRLETEEVLLPRVDRIRKEVRDEIKSLSKVFHGAINLNVLRHRARQHREGIERDLLAAFGA